MKSIRLIAVLIFALFMVVGAFAQNQQPAPVNTAPPATVPATAPVPEARPAEPKLTGIAADQEAVLTNLTLKVDAVERDVVAQPSDDDNLLAQAQALENLTTPILDIGLAFRPRLGEISAAITKLGPVPKEGEPAEPADSAATRQTLNKEKQQINMVVGQAEDLQIRVNGLSNKIAGMRKDLFGNLLFKKYDMEAAVGPQVGDEIGHEGKTFWRILTSWADFVWRNKAQSALIATLLAIGIGVVADSLSRRVFARAAHHVLIENPTYLRRLGVAFWSTVLPTIGFLIFMILVLWLYDYFNVLTTDSAIGLYIGSFFWVIFIAYFVNRLAHGVLSPADPSWRLLAIEPKPARLLIWMMTAAAFIVQLDTFLNTVSTDLGSPLSVTIVRSLAAAIIVGSLLVGVAWVKPSLTAKGEPRGWPTWFRIVLYVLGAATILSALSGYISLAQFIARQVVVTGAWLATAYIGLSAARAISQEGTFAGTWLGRWIKETRDADETTLDQIGVFLSIVLNLLIVLTFLPYVLFQLGYKPGDIAVWMSRMANGFQIGTFTFSPLAILTGLGVFAAGYFLTRWFQRWLDGTVLARSGVDAGVRNSIRVIVGYAGLAMAGLIAISSAGLDLSNLALIAGGLSLGIGFGLQNIVSNFVSGLILLVERPFKSGDWVVSGDVSGIVKRINVRATEIETFQRQTVLMPNSLLINNAVRNWTHRNRIGRVDIPVGVIYGTDPERVFNILKEIARNHRLALKNPEPMVLLTGFTDTAVNFEVRIFLGDIMSGSGVQNDVRVAIIERFHKEGVIIAHTPFSGDPEPAIDMPTPEQAEAHRAETKEPDMDQDGDISLDEEGAPKRKRNPLADLG